MEMDGYEVIAYADNVVVIVHRNFLKVCVISWKMLLIQKLLQLKNAALMRTLLKLS